MLGYVVRPFSTWHKPWYAIFRGRDVTTTMLNVHRGRSWFRTDEDAGMPPYPTVRDLDEGALEYLTQYLDYFQVYKSTFPNGY